MNKLTTGCLLLISSLIIGNPVHAKQDETVGGIGGTGSKEDITGGIGGTGILDKERPDLMERPELLDSREILEDFLRDGPGSPEGVSDALESPAMDEVQAGDKL